MLALFRCSEIDLLIGGYFQTSGALDFFSQSVTFSQDDVTWCVRSAAIIPIHFDPLAPSDPLCAAITIGLCLISGIFYFIYSQQDGRMAHRNKDIFYMLVLVVTSSFTGLGFSPHFRPHSTRFRLMYALMLTAGFVLALFWGCFLLSETTTTMHGKQVSNVDDLIQNNYTLKCSAMTLSTLLKQKQVNEAVDSGLTGTQFIARSLALALVSAADIGFFPHLR